MEFEQLELLRYVLQIFRFPVNGTLINCTIVDVVGAQASSLPTTQSFKYSAIYQNVPVCCDDAIAASEACGEPLCTNRPAMQACALHAMRYGLRKLCPHIEKHWTFN